MNPEATAESLWLPHPDYWEINPAKEKIPTPVDERGLIDVPQLIDAVKETVSPGYVWASKLSIHHLYWPEADYPYSRLGEGAVTARTFRNLPIHKALVPRIFENWLHKVTIPSEVPNREVMLHRVQSWNVAKDLFANARDAVITERLARRRRERIANNPDILKKEFNGVDVIGEEYIHSEFERCTRGIDFQLEKHDALPEVFKVIKTDASPAELAQQLGGIVMPKALQLVRTVNH